MPPNDTFADSDPCVLRHVHPLLNAPLQPPTFRLHGPAGPRRRSAEAFIRRVFALAYGADVHSFYPQLLELRHHNTLRAVIGYRDGTHDPLFCEQYLEQRLEPAIAKYAGHPISRDRLVEVGNLALTDPGEARWVIAIMTLYLYAQGYEWVLFTATRPLINAFRRLGLAPIELARADPRRLSDDGVTWGSYYDTQPTVCAGRIASGFEKLQACLHESGQDELPTDILRQIRGLSERDSAPHMLGARA
ncbi:thermostable hemolysin [Oleiagrimonas sp. C23AA]|uniref:thermostable hemolysin n=1 Tax=Oleiagrimonas sp. C23AA TaxID=2719047 RepID=UPI0014240973|nr:thermostable hemolysin [Oleiagrimonas sp. C23AA]NII10568.1 hypothetical protein [Oleiagrimonas sp. C23AA]